jgi:hypothetical protein
MQHQSTSLVKCNGYNWYKEEKRKIERWDEARDEVPVLVSARNHHWSYRGL